MVFHGRGGMCVMCFSGLPFLKKGIETIEPTEKTERTDYDIQGMVLPTCIE